MNPVELEDERSARPGAWDALGPALGRLDGLLARAVGAMRGAVADPFRGLHIGEADVDELLGRSPGEPWLIARADADADADAGAAWDWLAWTFGLSPMDLDVILIALGPHVDLKYEGIYAYLQDDVTRRRPGVDLALNLLCGSPRAKLAARARFAAEAPLIRRGLIRLSPPPGRADSPLLAMAIELDEQIVDALIGQGGVDRRLAGFCRRVEPAAGPGVWPGADRRLVAARNLVVQARASGRPLRLYLQGPRGGGQRQAAEALAAAAGAPLLAADLARAVDLERTARVLAREAELHDAVLLLEHVDVPRAVEPAWAALIEVVAEGRGVVILSGARPWPAAEATPGLGPLGVLTVPFGAPDVPARASWWRAGLEARGARLGPDDVETLARRFRFGPAAIAEAVATGIERARLRAAAAGGEHDRDDGPIARPTLDDLSAAARAETGQTLATLARRVEPSARWDDLVVPDDVLAQLRELLGRADGRSRVMDDWGFGRKLSRGRGSSALFAGASGTGKTMAAEIIAGELGLDLYAIDLAGVVSKWIGETEKNLDRIFQAAEDADAVLFFDEADALFGKRSEVRDARDRYANLEISYLLQRMEEYDGLAILATNLRQNLDDAFLRRLSSVIVFPFPEEAERGRIWRTIWPAEPPMADDVDLDRLARRFQLSGGQIKNIAVAAAHLAATDGGVVAMGHLLHATRREYQKLGKRLSDAELTGEPGEETP